MLFATLNQGLIFLFLLSLGGCIAFCDEFVKMLLKKRTKASHPKINKEKNTDIVFVPQKSTKNTKKLSKIAPILQYFRYFIKYLLIGIVFYLVIFYIDYGVVRFYHIVAFCVGFVGIKSIFVSRNAKAKNI